MESAVQDYEARVIQRQKEAVEAAQREEERQRLLAEEEARRKKEEEERKAKVAEEEERRKKEEEERMKREKEESEVRERIRTLEKVKEIAEQDPAFLEASGLQVSATRTTYPAVDGGKCERCMNRNLVGLGIAGKRSEEHTSELQSPA